MIQVLPERRTLHGHFSRDLAPIAEVGSGDTVRFTTLDGDWGLEPHDGEGAPHRQFEPRDPVLDAGHALCGPIAIRRALPGMVLEVAIGEIRTGSWGWTVAGGFANHVTSRLGLTTEGCRLRWDLDRERGVATSSLGRRVAMRPFMGVMGMPPAEPGIHRTGPPRVTGGNIDCKELVSGTTLWLPIAVPGGLFSAGDGHAAQGDGEVGKTALECPIERCDLTLTLRPDLSLSTRARRRPTPGSRSASTRPSTRRCSGRSTRCSTSWAGATAWRVPRRWRWRASRSTSGSRRSPTVSWASTPCWRRARSADAARTTARRGQQGPLPGPVQFGHTALCGAVGQRLPIVRQR